jgi:hypothetical protein
LHKPAIPEIAKSSQSHFCQANSRFSHKSLLSAVLAVPSACMCQSGIKDISNDLKEFISSVFTWALALDIAHLYAFEKFLLLSEYFPHPYERPG